MTYSKVEKNGYLLPIAGESYIELVQFTKEGVLIESVNAFGASSKIGQPHSTDQMELYSKRQLKKMSMDREEIEKGAERIYHPK